MSCERRRDKGGSICDWEGEGGRRGGGSGGALEMPGPVLPL